jgi:DnaJ-class molecular chaperone
MTHLIVAALIVLALYAAFCMIRPTKACRRCGGWGSKAARRRRAPRRHCHRCDGTGERFRVPSRVAYGIRGAMRRHGELTARAAERSGERERVKS